MALPTSTLEALRTKIAGLMRMRFFRIYGTSSTLTAAASANNVADSTLLGDDDDWNGSWFYDLDTEEQDFIVDYDGTDGVLLLRHGLVTPVTGHNYQIFDLISPSEINGHINSAIDSAWPDFFEISEDESLVVQKGIKEYTISGLSPRPYKVMKVEVEYAPNSIASLAASGTTGSVTMPSGIDLTDLEAGDKVSIYDGTGKGQLATVASVASQVITLNETLDTAPDSTSYIRIWRATEDQRAWTLLFRYRLSGGGFPDKIHFSQNLDRWKGFRFRIQYSSKSDGLTSDADTTYVPADFISAKAMEYIYSAMIGNNRVDRQRFASQAELNRNKAEVYRQRNAWPMPSSSVPNRLEDGDGYYDTSDGNPFDWPV